MKKYFKVLGYILLTILVCLYLSFLFILPRKIDLNVYKPDIQKFVVEHTGLNIDYDSINVITTPLLEAGVKTSNTKVTLPDNSVLFSADSFKGKVFLPGLLWLSVNVSCADVEKPKLNVEILNSEKFKVAKVYEDLVNKRRQERRLKPSLVDESEITQLPFDMSKIKVRVPALKLNNYSAMIDDVSAGHKLTLQGEQLKLGYFNGKNVKLKTKAEFLSDNDTNITANIDIDSFIPEFLPAEQEEEDNEAVFELPFVNPVTAYRDYNLKSIINSKLKIRKDKNDEKFRMYGFVDIEGTTVTMSGLQLPESYFRLHSKGTLSEIETNLYVTDKEFINLEGTIDYGKNPYLDLSLKSPKVHLANILKITKAYLDTIHIKNDIEYMSASGYLLANANLKTDFTDIISTGKVVVRGGNIVDKNIGLLFNDINANLFFDDNVFKVTDTHALINNHLLELAGKVDSNSIANLYIKGDRIPLPALYTAFAPRDIKQAYNLISGFLTINAKITGEIKDIAALWESDLDNLVLRDRKGNFILSNSSAHFGIANSLGKIRGRIKNKGFKLVLLKTNSEIRNDLLTVDIDNKLIKANKSNFKLNNNSQIAFSGSVENYISNPESKFFTDGHFAASDLGHLLGKQIAPYFDIKGVLPCKASFRAKGKKINLIAQVKANEVNYITPVKFEEFAGKQTILQFMLEKNGDTIKVNRTGLYTSNDKSRSFVNNLPANLVGTREVVAVRAMVSNLSTNPFINIIKITIPKTLNGSIHIFKNSKFTLGGQVYIFGTPQEPHINGNFDIRNLHIPEIFTSIRHIAIDLHPKNVNAILNDVDANGSDFKVSLNTTWNLLPKLVLSEVNVSSRFANADKLNKTAQSLMKVLPSSSGASAKNADIPVEIRRGSIKFKKLVSGKLVVLNTTARLSLLKNILYLNKLKTNPLGGQVHGDVSMNLLSTRLDAKVYGKNFSIEKVLLDVLNMKDTLSGNLKFAADISMKGLSVEEQMKTLKGSVDFDVKNGQLGPFGKFENFLMAENIRDNAFFSSTIGSVISDIVTVDTSHFNYMYGRLTFADGVAEVAPLKTQGDVMSMYVAGKVNLLDNSADLKLRGKLASSFSDKLGPLANINPINLVKNTPGLNIVAAKTFMVFCEVLSEEEMRAIPHLGAGKSDDYATKFQIKLHGDTRKPLKMIKSFKWLALDSEIESAQDFVDTIPTPVEGEENMTIEEIIQLRKEQAEAAAQNKTLEEYQSEKYSTGLLDRLKHKMGK